MAKEGKYIYGIINSDKELFYGLYGINTCAEIYTIPYQDIAAVVSNSEVLDYTHMFKDTLARILVRHQNVIEKIMQLKYTVIPVRLGTFAIDEEEVKCILAKGYSKVEDIFNKISDKKEIDVVATWNDFSSVLKEVGEEKEIKELRDKILINPEGVTVDDQTKIGGMVKNYLDKIKEKYACQIQTSLSKISEDIKVHELMDDTMVANFAFLINEAKLEDFDNEVEKLNTEFREKLNFRSVGPLPPYSFYTLEIKKLQFEEIDWARNKLELQNNFATKKEIKKAHQKLAFSFHPDRNPNTTDAERKFVEITRAYNILWEYCQGDECSFNKEEFKNNAILVKVKE